MIEHEIEARAVKDSEGEAQLFDLWVDGEWIGSRSTIRQCEAFLSYVCGVEVNAVYGRPW